MPTDPGKELTMVLILDGNSEIGALCLRHLIRSRAVTFRIFFSRKDLFPFMHALHVLNYHIIKEPWS